MRIFNEVTRIFTILMAVLLMAGCSWNSTMGDGDRFHVASTSSAFAPSVTTVVDKETGAFSTYAGPSVVGQLAGAAGTAAGGYLLGVGIAKSGTTVSQNGGGATQTQLQGQIQGQAQGVAVNGRGR